MTVQQPSLCRAVLVKTPGREINGQTEHAAVVTQVWSSTDPERTSHINATIFPGSGESFSLGSIVFHENVPEGYTGATWRWPPRV